MRVTMGIFTVAGLIASSAAAQDALSYSLDGRIGLGYLNEKTAEPSAEGFQYKGPVAIAELVGRAEFQVTEDLRFGALARVFHQRGTDSTYDLIISPGEIRGGGAKFGGTELDSAVYAGIANVTLSYGNMETAFDLATLEIEQGHSLLDGGNAVWMNIGDGAGSTGPRGAPSASGPLTGPDVRTLRLDLQVGEVSFSASRSKGKSNDGPEIQIDAAGAVWRHEIEAVTLFAGAGYDKGPDYRFNAFSFGLTSGGLNVVFNRIHRTQFVLSPTMGGSYDTSYEGFSLSYDFGDVTLGTAHASQTSKGDGVFDGTAQAVFASWQAREDLAVDFEFSESDYKGSGDNTRKASVAVVWEF